MMFDRSTLRGVVALAALVGVSACADHGPGMAGNPPGTAAERALDRAAGTNTSGAYPAQSDGTRANPPGTQATRALDRAAGTDVSGAYPRQRDCTPGNPPGTQVSRALGTTDPNTCR
ncbi:hypothetical protein LPC08_13330 [Roseomonas sp. OT10]|uniref:hypothetical protein n=1 Tax=Roseomonas cutis TaxID=2897332 RepID=UPI001E2BA228|nr:hypothetical protein [Roseomonas sp. OT10]UFN47009.1 hypothetical protein LPC08_13330 [Roseomonas sp. OT10]